MAVHSNDEPHARRMLKVPTEYALPAAFVAIYDDISRLKHLAGDNGSYSRRELAYMVREYEQRNGGPWTAPPAKAEVTKSVAQAPKQKELAKA